MTLAYSELVKNFNRIRDYMREFYVYGFKKRDEFKIKSLRSYDNERRRLESWLGEYMQFRHNADGKNVFISIDSRVSCHNPLYKAWKTKSFTDGDITLHFIIMDIMTDVDKAMTVKEITEKIDGYFNGFNAIKLFDQSTVRKKLNEYVKEGIILAEKRGKILYYKLSSDFEYYNTDILNFFSEVSPCGVIGSFLLDKKEMRSDYFYFKHHYITGAMDSEILFSLFEAIGEKRNIIIKTVHRNKDIAFENFVMPLKIFISVQNGRQYLMAYNYKYKRIIPFRIDNIVSVELKDRGEDFCELRKKLNDMKKHMWGISAKNKSHNLEYVEFTVKYEDDEQYIHKRLEREKRCGNVEKIDNNTSRFYAEIYDLSEIIPWIRTFICRITDIHFSDENIEKQFKKDLHETYRIYGLEGGDDI